ncbi:Hsp20/alpha crystallin family protein [Sunxiuqinia sp. A32]|uniref:Hsp20/alpha crystallin family protein n=1 Tax=Sunxiuqinia sp. A32 TaxID=3461496 RepID=UPI0040467F49
MLPLIRNKQNIPNLFEDFFGRNLWSDLFEESGWSNTPSVNVYEGNDQFEIEVAAPGLEKKDFHIDLKDNVLTISSETKTENEEKDGNKVVFREFNYSAFRRSFRLPDGIDGNKIKASHKNGILKVELPKRDEFKAKEPRQISIS